MTLFGGVLTVFFDVAYQSYLPSLIGQAQPGGGKRQAPGLGLGGTGGRPERGRRPDRARKRGELDSGGCRELRRIGDHDLRRSRLESLHRHPAKNAAPFVTRSGRDCRSSSAIRSCGPSPARPRTSNFFSGVQTAVEVVFLVRVLHQPPGVIGLLFGAGSVGGITRGHFAASRAARLVGGARATIWAVGFSGLGGSAPSPDGARRGLSLFAVGFFLSSFGVLVYNVNQVSFRQRLCPERLLGRMNATMRFLVWGTLPLGGLLGGFLGTIIDVRNTLWVSGGCGTLAVLWLLASPMRGMRDFPDEHDDDGPETVGAITLGGAIPPGVPVPDGEADR